uniref:fasciclin domain-containing protein n=1 Tax=Flavobacterium sp. TaxID=239 RepID=UPI00404B6618
MNVNAQKQDKGVKVAGTRMYASKSIVENTAESEKLSTLNTAIEVAGLEENLKYKGPFTFFAPTNDAFEALPEGTVEMLMKPENVSSLQMLLSYHVVPGVFTAADLEQAILDGNGQVKLTTLNGATLTAWKNGNDFYLADEQGNQSKITLTNANQSNGIIHVVDNVVMTKA